MSNLCCYVTLSASSGKNKALFVLQSILEQQEVNWRALLAFVAVFLVCYKDGPERLKGQRFNPEARRSRDPSGLRGL